MERFAQFEILRPLGVGGMAETALAVRRGPDDFEQRVCLKRILPAFSKDPEFVRAFQNEAKIAVRLVHPHVCRLYDFGNHEGTFWMSMEFLEGGDLRSLLETLQSLRQPLPIDVVLLLALDIASALHYAHELRIDGKRHEIVHRDISPSNVLIDSTGHFKLADFGIAKVTAGGEITRTGVVKGKIPYMSPEHARGQKIDARADLWSFGVMLFEALAGERPFRGSHEVETLLNVTEGRRKKLIEAAPHTPKVLADVIERLLEPDLEKRTRRAADVIEALAATPPPANARLKLHALIERMHDEHVKTDRRAAAEAATDLASEASTRASAEPTVLGPDGAAVGKAPQPVSAPPDAATRAAQPLLVAMDTAALPAGAVGKPTIKDIHPSTDVRMAAAEAAAIDRAIDTERQAAMRPLSPSITETEAVATPFGATPSPVRRWAQVVVALAVVGTLGLGGAVLAFGRGRPAAVSTSATVGAPPPVGVPSVAVTTTEPGAVAPAEPVVVEAPAVPAPVVDPAVVAPVAVEPTVEASGAPVAEPAPEATGDPSAEGEPAEERATLMMTAVPWGNIWLDGRRLGIGPVTRRVEPGRHVVGAGPGDRAVATRTVTVGAGEHERVVLRVNE